MSTTALDLITGALQRINSYQSGEQIATADQQDCLSTLNDMLDSWSTDHLSIVGSEENIFSWTVNQIQYKLGNPTCLELGEPNIVGTVTGASPTITDVTVMPADLMAGGTLTDVGNVIPAGTTVVSFDADAQTITMSANATATYSANPDSITYTIPGDIPIPRPLRITHGFTRINQLDFWMEITMSQDRFLEILYKFQPGPWPVCGWYNPTFPYGLLNVYMAPGMAAEAHVFTDNILGNLTIDQVLILPQGYSRAIKWNLAKELCAEYGFPLSETIKLNAKESYHMIKTLNAVPAVVSRYDRELVRGNRPDGGWITHGGYR